MHRHTHTHPRYWSIQLFCLLCCCYVHQSLHCLPIFCAWFVGIKLESCSATSRKWNSIKTHQLHSTNVEYISTAGKITKKNIIVFFEWARARVCWFIGTWHCFVLFWLFLLLIYLFSHLLHLMQMCSVPSQPFHCLSTLSIPSLPPPCGGLP